jgi:hypothetical protein
MMTWFDKTVDMICKPSSYASKLKELDQDGSDTVAVEDFLRAFEKNGGASVISLDEEKLQKYFA